MMSRTPIGGLLLDAEGGWSFSVRDGTIAGKLGEQPGLLRVTTLAPNQLPQPLTHERCLQLAADWVGAAQAKLFDRQLTESATGPFGSASFLRGKDYVSVWYCTRPAGLIMGAYACPADFGRTPDARFIRARCARMIGSALFDRGSWGAQDELTKFLISELAPPEPNSPRPPSSPEVPSPPPAAPARTAAPPKRRPP
jgi:hypothetical protein